MRFSIRALLLTTALVAGLCTLVTNLGLTTLLAVESLILAAICVDSCRTAASATGLQRWDSVVTALVCAGVALVMTLVLVMQVMLT